MDIQKLFKWGMDRDIPGSLPFPSGNILDLGAGRKDFAPAFRLGLPDWDADKEPIPFGDGFFSGIHCYHFLEHVADPIAVLREIERVLESGGVVNIVVPYYNSQLQAKDLTHRRAFCEETWRILFNNEYYDVAGSAKRWKFRVGLNIIIGIAERNLCLMTQLIRE